MLRCIILIYDGKFIHNYVDNSLHVHHLYYQKITKLKKKTKIVDVLLGYTYKRFTRNIITQKHFF